MKQFDFIVMINVLTIVVNKTAYYLYFVSGFWLNQGRSVKAHKCGSTTYSMSTARCSCDHFFGRSMVSVSKDGPFLTKRNNVLVACEPKTKVLNTRSEA